MQSADDLAGQLAAIDAAGTLQRARDAVREAEADRNRKQSVIDGFCATTLIAQAAISTGKLDRARAELLQAERALAAAEETLAAMEADAVARALAVIDPALATAAGRIASALEEIEAAFCMFEVVQRDARLRRLKIPNLANLCAVNIASVRTFGQRLEAAVSALRPR
jgi:hypothetical protein